MILSKLHLDSYEAENNRSCCVDFFAIPYLKPYSNVMCIGTHLRACLASSGTLRNRFGARCGM